VERVKSPYSMYCSTAQHRLLKGGHSKQQQEIGGEICPTS
jgi:hypothetical protein